MISVSCAVRNHSVYGEVFAWSAVVVAIVVLVLNVFVPFLLVLKEAFVTVAFSWRRPTAFLTYAKASAHTTWPPAVYVPFASVQGTVIVRESTTVTITGQTLRRFSVFPTRQTRSPQLSQWAVANTTVATFVAIVTVPLIVSGENVLFFSIVPVESHQIRETCTSCPNIRCDIENPYQKRIGIL